MTTVTTVFSLFFLLLFLVLLALTEASPDTDLLAVGKCAGQWRPEKLPGRCSGLSRLSHFPAVRERGISHLITNSTACRALCCNLGAECVSWQFELTTKECKLGPVMRLGNENAGVPGWCEPLPPVKWNGLRVKHRDRDTGEVLAWDEEKPLQTQCFGLGDERKALSTGGRMDTQQCREACGKDRECALWQEYPGRGCFYFSNRGVHCEEKKNPVYVGGRKCIPGYCSDS